MPWVAVTDPNEIAVAKAGLGGGKPSKVDPVAREAARASEQRRMQQIVGDAKDARGRAVGAIEAASTWVQPTTGILGRVMSGIPGTAAYNLDKKLDTLRANIGFSELSKMRAASPTGGALGAVSERENMLLQSVLGSFDQGQDVDQLKGNLDRVSGEYEAMLRDRGAPVGAVARAAAAPRPAAPAAQPKPVASGWGKMTVK